MKLKAGTTVTVKLDGEEYQFLLVHAGGDGTERLSLKAPLAQLLSTMEVGDIRMWRWQVSMRGNEKMRVELVEVEEAEEQQQKPLTLK